MILSLMMTIDPAHWFSSFNTNTHYGGFARTTAYICFVVHVDEKASEEVNDALFVAPNVFVAPRRVDAIWGAFLRRQARW